MASLGRSHPMPEQHPMFFDQERRTRCAMSLGRDLAASTPVATRRAAHLRHVESLAARLPGTEAEQSLLITH